MSIIELLQVAQIHTSKKRLTDSLNLSVFHRIMIGLFHLTNITNKD